jgi:hypothetical protein
LSGLEAIGATALIVLGIAAAFGAVWLVMTVIETSNRVERHSRARFDADQRAQDERGEIRRRLLALEAGKATNVKK